MSVELLILLGVCGYGAIQALATGPIEPMRQIHRNFSETFYLFAICILLLHALNAFGNWSLKGAVVYAAGRALYLVFFHPAIAIGAQMDVGGFDRGNSWLHGRIGSVSAY